MASTGWNFQSTSDGITRTVCVAVTHYADDVVLATAYEPADQQNAGPSIFTLRGRLRRLSATFNRGIRWTIVSEDGLATLLVPICVTRKGALREFGNAAIGKWRECLDEPRKRLAARDRITHCVTCANVLTVSDRGRRCRQCHVENPLFNYA